MGLKYNPSNVAQELIEEIAEAYNLDFPENLEKLASFFGHSNWLMRKLAADYACRIGDRVLDPLFSILEHPDASEDTLYWGLKVYSKFFDAASPYIVKLMGCSHFDNNKLIYLINAAGALKITDATPALIEYLGHKNWIVRKEAASSIQAIGRGAVPYLKSAFTSGNKDIRYWTVKILGQLLGREAIDSFKKLLASDKKDLRYYALTALGEIDSPEVTELIAGCLGDESWLVRAQAAEVLERKGRAAIKHIKSLFSKGNSDVKYWSIKVLAKILKEEALDFLKRTLDTEDSELKYCVIDALAQMNFSKVAPVLLTFFDDPAWLVRKHVASVFEKFGSQAAEYLSKALEAEDNENIRYWAVQIISRSDDKYFMKLLEVLRKPGKPERAFIIQSLRETKNPLALPALFDLLSDAQWTIRREASHTIADFGADQVVPFIIDNVDLASGDIEYWVQKIVSSYDDSVNESVKKLIEDHGDFIDENDPKYAKLQKTYQLLSLLGNQKSVDMALDILRSQLHDQKEHFVNSLTGIRNDYFIKNLLKAIDSADSGTASWIARLLKNISKNCYHLLYGALDDKNPEKRVWICRIFGEIKDQAFISPLVILLSDADKNVRFEATKVLSKFASDEVFEQMIKQFLEEDEEGRICIIENIKSLVDEKMVALLVESLDDSSDTDAYWIAKLLVETAKSHTAFLEKKYEKSIDSSRPKYWLKKILDHLRGVSYL